MVINPTTRKKKTSEDINIILVTSYFVIRFSVVKLDNNFCLLLNGDKKTDFQILSMHPIKLICLNKIKLKRRLKTDFAELFVEQLSSEIYCLKKNVNLFFFVFALLHGRIRSSFLSCGYVNGIIYFGHR